MSAPSATPPAETPAAAPEAPLGRLVRRALGWSFLGTGLVRLGSVLSGIVLARLLDPQDFGVYAVGAVALYITASINDLGIEPTLVRWPGDLRKVAPTAVTVVMASSTALFAIFWFGAPWFASLFHSPDATGIVRIMSVALILSGAGRVSAALITRRFDQRSRTVADVSGTVVTIGSSIVLAASGFGPYSLAWSHLAGIVVTVAILLVATPTRYGPGFDRRTAGLLLRSGVPIAGAGLVTVAIQNVDYLVVGNVLGAGAVGLYMLAWNISSFPVNLLTVSISHVSVAGFATMQDDPERLQDAFGRSFGAVMALALPLAALLGALSLPTVRFVYGEKWTETAAPLAFLALLGAYRVGTQLVTDVLVAVGRGRTVVALHAAWLVTLVPVLIVGANLWGIRGVGLGQLVVALLVAPLYLRALGRLGIGARRLGAVVARPALGALGVAAVCLAVQRLGLPDPATIAVATVAAGALYLAVNRRLVAPLVRAVRPAPKG